MNFIYRMINNSIMAYKSNTGNMPNTIILNKDISAELEKTIEKENKFYVSKGIDGTEKIYKFKIIVSNDFKCVTPIKIEEQA